MFTIHSHDWNDFLELDLGESNSILYYKETWAAVSNFKLKQYILDILDGKDEYLQQGLCLSKAGNKIYSLTIDDKYTILLDLKTLVNIIDLLDEGVLDAKE